MASDFHPDFWVVVGTAAPVLVLSAIVSTSTAIKSGTKAFIRFGQFSSDVTLAGWGLIFSIMSVVTSFFAGGFALVALASEHDSSIARICAIVLLGLSVITVYATTGITVINDTSAPNHKATTHGDGAHHGTDSPGPGATRTT